MQSIIHSIKNGLLQDLHIAERAFLLNRQINRLQTQIPFGIKSDISKILFDLSYTEMVLSLCRLYDHPSKKYKTHCLKQLYEQIKKVDYNVELKESKTNVLKELVHLREFPEMYVLFASKEDTQFNKDLIMYLETMEQNEPLFSAIQMVKQIRDKLLGHREDIQLDTLIPYNTIEVLINHAKEVMSFFSLAYTGIHLTANDNFYLSRSSAQWQSIFKKFILDGA